MAFKVVTDFVEKPVFLLSCDRACGINAQMQVEPGQERFHQAQVAFMNEAIRTGWRITFENHICPAHVKAEAENTPRILVPQVTLARN